MINEKGVAISYGDVAPEAKENFIPEITHGEATSFSQIELLNRYNVDYPNIANPCELYQTVLDGSASAFPDSTERTNFGVWSEEITDEFGDFGIPIRIEFEAEEGKQYSSQGITFTFDTQNNIYPRSINIRWLRITDEGIEELADETFEPDSAFYFCRCKVENYNKIVVVIFDLNMPYSRLKLRAIDYGYGTVFFGNELRSTKLIQEINPISSEISINTVDFGLDSKTDMEYSFQAKQPLTVRFNGILRATAFVKSAKRKSKFLWEIQSEDYIGLMDGIPFRGGIYTDKDAYDLLVEIFTVAKVPYNINEGLKGVSVNGYIPYTTCRDALMQVAFAVQNIVDTSGSEVVNVYALSEDVPQTIPLSRIMQGQSFTDEETVTGVEVTCHTYTPIEESVEVYTASDSGSGEGILVRFSEPLHDLSIDEGVIVEYGANYAIINANDNCILSGKKYEHTTLTRRKNNPVVLASEIEKLVAVDNATLVSPSNVEFILGRCYDWLTKVNTTSLKIVEGKHIETKTTKYGRVKYGQAKYGDTEQKIVTYDKEVKVGDIITSETEYLGDITGRVIKQTFSLAGGIIVKDTVIK